jgi:glutamate-1-semialdehyde 2,1-aminomutase
VTPDLSTFGKGIANGYPVSAVVGRADVMALMEEIFFSFTFGGETLSLAAAKATLEKIRERKVCDTLKTQGEKVLHGLKGIIQQHKLGEILDTAGHPSWSFLVIKDTPPYTSWQIKTLFLQEIFARGLLCLGTHNMSYSHSDKDVEKIINVYSEVLPLLGEAVREKSLEKMLCAEPLKPLFKVR